MILSASDPSVVLVRTSEPLLRAEHALERTGIVPNVVFPTTIEEIDGRPSVFYGMDGSSSSTAWPTPASASRPSTASRCRHEAGQVRPFGRTRRRGQGDRHAHGIVTKGPVNRGGGWPMLGQI